MNRATKVIVTLFGGLAATMVVLQLVFGLLLKTGRVNFLTAHQHTGYTTVCLTLIYIVISLSVILSQPSPQEPKS